MRRAPRSSRVITAFTAVAAVVALSASVPAGAVGTPIAQPALAGASGPVGSGDRYLALGDSVVFGYREPTNRPTPDYTEPDTFVGYPEDVAADLSLVATNASCPGETSASLIDATAPSNGCETQAGSTLPGYRALFGLHVSYSGSQLDYAVHFLRRHPSTRLVTLMVGANDGFLCQETTADHCVSELPALLAKVSANVATIVRTIRHEAHYERQLVIVGYYSLNYADPVATALSAALNQAVVAGAQPYRIRVADGFGAFQRAALQAGGDTCAAGLLTILSGGGCGVHPSVAGQALLATAVERVVRKA